MAELVASERYSFELFDTMVPCEADAPLVEFSLVRNITKGLWKHDAASLPMHPNRLDPDPSTRTTQEL